MATIKSYTDLEQSRKLAEILPLESADMVYVHTTDLEGDEHYDIDFRRNQPLFEDDVYAWSLAALLSIFECYEINKFGNNIQFDAKGIALSTEENETILDIVVDMIILLHKQNLL